MNDSQPPVDYRSRLYENYAALMGNSCSRFDMTASERWGKAYRHYLRGWLPGHNARVLDLGCGSGRLLHFFRGRGYTDVTGVDASPGQVALARQVADRVFEQNVLDYLATTAERFDLITGFDIIEHLGKDEVFVFLDGCHRVLKPGGRLILQTPNADSPWASSVRYGDFTHEVCFNRDSLASVLHASGFMDVQARELGPIAFGYSALSFVRFLLWRSIRSSMSFWNAAETGSTGSGVLTRVFLASAIRPPSA